ncbi:hypothetical protein HGRIS_003566 [Hohenbuehelia grisea]|uniref:ATP-dependent RNA helicase n=1 Tax=Hohenbuehelia grisea TaxID=104357 RepID=A0ABR3JGB3_9AGAR
MPLPTNAKSATASSGAPKSKTKAKQRYLKQKKDRKRLRPKGGALLANGNPTAEAQDSEDDGGDDGDDVEMVNVEEDAEEEIITSRIAARLDTPAQTKEKRPKKRRKVELDEPESERARTVDDARPPSTEARNASSLPRSPSPPAPALPSFPLPALPNPPSKSDLALQGLDKALVDAQLIEPSTLLPLPLEGEDDGGSGLSEGMRKRLKELGITELFAVQTALLPFLLPRDRRQRAAYLPYNPPRDVCVSAPTGSGKTLAYVLPIIEILTSRVVTQLRALVVLPTRDLVNQVRETFEALGKGRGLKIATATGQHSFAHEQSQLIADKSLGLMGGSSKVDILICTPGRLMDHLTGTKNFTLQHLRFLVIDEADRLLAQSFQDWLAQVLAATRPPQRALSERPPRGPASDAPRDFVASTPDSLAPAFLHLLSIPDIPCFLTEKKESSCQKLLFSATLTRDPGKIAALDLRNPKYFVVQGARSTDEEDASMLDVAMEKFTMPESLSETFLVCETARKPLLLFHLLHEHNVTNALVFTKSAESTARLVQLITFFEAAYTSQGKGSGTIIAQAYSSDLANSERKTILEKFKAQQIHILVCSDLISRGIDISHVTHVVNYDAPVDMRKYVHRVGRTARAGRAGHAWTLVEEQEARYFKTMMRAADHMDKVKRMKVKEADLSSMTQHFEHALGRMRDFYAAARSGAPSAE